MAESIVDIGEGEASVVKEQIVDRLYKFPGNSQYQLKTINNWRTEISTLFALYFQIDDWIYPSEMAKQLAEEKDLTRFFKYFLYSFQYPGGHLKANTILEIKQNNISFHPAGFIVNLLKYLKENYQQLNHFITKAELTHCVFNDLRITTKRNNKESIKLAADIIVKNRENNIEYDWSGDLVRYAGDILDYMELGNLVRYNSGKFYLRSSEERAISKFLARKPDFGYEKYSTIEAISETRNDWFVYCNAFAENNIFKTDVLAFIAKDDAEYAQLEERTLKTKEMFFGSKFANTTQIGDQGESLVYAHEVEYLKQIGQEDLASKVKCLPNQFAVGYDIQSFNESGFFKYIEVKTTISTRAITTNRFAMTRNELSSAQTLGQHYYVYRLILNHANNGESKLIIINDPIALFKKGILEINLGTGDVVIKSYNEDLISTVPLLLA